MLILSEKGESIMIGEDIEIFVADVWKGMESILAYLSGGYEDIEKNSYLTVENNKEASDKVDLLKVFQLSAACMPCSRNG